MTALMLALSLRAAPIAPAPTWLNTGRVVDTPALHVGVRPQVFISADELDLGATLQISTLLL